MASPGQLPFPWLPLFLPLPSFFLAMLLLTAAAAAAIMRLSDFFSVDADLEHPRRCSCAHSQRHSIPPLHLNGFFGLDFSYFFLPPSSSLLFGFFLSLPSRRSLKLKLDFVNFPPDLMRFNWLRLLLCLSFCLSKLFSFHKQGKKAMKAKKWML